MLARRGHVHPPPLMHTRQGQIQENGGGGGWGGKFVYTRERVQYACSLLFCMYSLFSVFSMFSPARKRRICTLSAYSSCSSKFLLGQDTGASYIFG